MPKCKSCGLPAKVITARRKLEAAAQKLKEQNKTLKADMVILKRELEKSNRLSAKAKEVTDVWRIERKDLKDTILSLEGRLRTAKSKQAEATRRAENLSEGRRQLAAKLRDIQKITKGVIW